VRSILIGTLVSLAAIGAVERLFRATGGMPSVVPGMTRVEYQWKMKRTHDRNRLVYVVGDSRVGWGFAERVFNDAWAERHHAHDAPGINAGVPASAIASNIDYLVDLRADTTPETLVVNYSPVGFYYFLNFPDTPVAGLKIQDALDDRLDTFLAERLWTRGRPVDVVDHFREYIRNGSVPAVVNWVHRVDFADGFVNATLGTNTGAPVDAAAYELAFFDRFVSGVRSNPTTAVRRRDVLAAAVRRAITRGWRVVLVRFPVGARMRQLEAQLPADLLPDAFAHDLDLQFTDYNRDRRTAELQTQDESHLTPDAARALAPILADDLSAIVR